MTRPFRCYPRPDQQEPLPLSDDKGPYYPDPALARAVCTALAVGQPLLVTGEPGCGKSTVAWSIAAELGLDQQAHQHKRAAVARYHTRSDSQGRDLLYRFDGLRRLYDAQAKDHRATEPSHYIKLEALGEAIADAAIGLQRVVLIDEVDKAPPDLPNDLLDPLDRMEFQVAETGAWHRAPKVLRPVVIITSNQDRQLPQAFLRRCVYHHIDFPKEPELKRILSAHCQQAEDRLRQVALQRFLAVRALLDAEGKPPSLGELITWVHALHGEGVRELPEELWTLPSLGALVKRKEDHTRLGAPPAGAAVKRKEDHQRQGAPPAAK